MRLLRSKMKHHSHQFCTFYVDHLSLGIDVQRVQEVIRYQRMTRVPLAPGAVSGLINLRGQIVVALDLRCRLGLPCRAAEELPMNVVVRDGDNAISLLVDRIGDVVEVDDEFFEPPPATVRPCIRSMIQGTYKLPNQLLLVLDTERVIEETESLTGSETRIAG
jgi:purine-binding chemotaxis protein CheW